VSPSLKNELEVWIKCG